MVTGHDIMQFPYQKEILCASPKQPTYRRYWGRRRKEEGREEGSIVRGNKAGKMFEVHIKQKESKGDHGYHTTGERWRDMEGEDRYYHTVLKGKEMPIFSGHIIQGKIDFFKNMVLWHIPRNHLLLFIWGMTSTAQYFGRSGEKVQAVVLEVLIYQRQEDL